MIRFMVGILLILGNCQNPQNDSSGQEFKMLEWKASEIQESFKANTHPL